MKRKYLIGILLFASLLAIGMVLTPAMADTNPDDNYDDSDTRHSPWEIILSTTTYDDAWYEVWFAGTPGWSEDTFILRDWPGGVIQIHIYDRFWVGDFYGVYLVDTAKNEIIRTMGISPEVETDWHHGSVTYPCLVGDPLHTGTGTVYSEAWFDAWLPAGTHTFKVRNELAQKLIAEGLDPTNPPWLPSGFYIGWHYPWQVPEFSFSVPTVTAIAAAIFLFIKRKFPMKAY